MIIKSFMELPKIQQVLWRYHEIYREVAEEWHAEEYNELPEREQLIVRYCSQYMEGFNGSWYEIVESVAKIFEETLGIKEPEDLYKLAAMELRHKWEMLQHEDTYSEWTDAHEARVAEMERKYHLMVPEENN